MKQYLVPILLLIIVGAGAYFVVQSVQEGASQAQQALAPIAQANSAMQTQVSELLNPTPTIVADPVTIINEIRALARLETIQYNETQVVHYEDRQGTLGFLFGTKFLVVVHGIVIAGIDMEKIRPEDMKLEGSVLYVQLPPAEVFITALNNSETEVYTIQDGLWAEIDPNMVIKTLGVGEEAILNAALEDGILDTAQKNAESYLKRFYDALGYENVIFLTP
ncbi:MAG: DUF4230 domain-containing protein [Anaerolineales bacterium]|uniref:DUF4230 domain-containing protein n=1 Tax=Candidatus Desulfolinea nitratireducens TaxID=2841698 RepID=A0A8J6NJT8_9CHLR|nr:DUF4230 domain-containing protein [Candidatus Desulfolinea nitratireducens]